MSFCFLEDKHTHALGLSSNHLKKNTFNNLRKKK